MGQWHVCSKHWSESHPVSCFFAICLRLFPFGLPVRVLPTVPRPRSCFLAVHPFDCLGFSPHLLFSGLEFFVVCLLVFQWQYISFPLLSFLLLLKLKWLGPFLYSPSLCGFLSLPTNINFSLAKIFSWTWAHFFKNLQNSLGFLFLFWPCDPTLTASWLCTPLSSGAHPGCWWPLFLFYLVLAKITVMPFCAYFPSHKIEVKTICMPVSYCFMKARGGLAQSNNLMETLRDLAHFVSRSCSLCHSQSFRTSLLLLFLPQHLAVGTSWYFSLSWFVSFLMFVSTCLFSPFLPRPISQTVTF